MALSRSDVTLDMVTSAKALVVDVETTGTDPFEDRVIGWVFADEARSVYVPVRHTGGGNRFDDPTAWERNLRYAFQIRARLGLLTIGHRLPFDLWFAAKEGVIMDDGPLEDTMLNEVLLQDNVRRYDLESSCERRGTYSKSGDDLYTALQARFGHKRQVGRGNMAHFHKLRGDDPLAYNYATDDGRATYELWKAQQTPLDDLGLRRVHALECKLLPHLARMRRRGIKIDLAYLEQAFDELESERMSALRYFPEGFDIGKSDDIHRFLYDQGHRQFRLTPKLGKPQFTESSLQAYGEHGQQILRLRRAVKTQSSFVKPLRAAADHGGRVHPDLVQFATEDGGTHTGRFACKGPNLQAYPKRRKEVGKVVRPIFVADEGMVFGEADVSQQEPRLYACYGNEESLLKGYNSNPPTDVHTISAREMGINRDFAKTLGLSVFNGMQSRSLASRLGVPESEAVRLLRKWDDIYPGIADFKQRAKQRAAQHLVVTTLLGRRANFSGWDETYMAVSRIIQGSAADQMKLMMLRAFEYTDAHPEVQLLLSIHDSIMFQAEPGADLKEFQAVLEDNSELNLPVPFPVELSTGPNWGVCSYGAEAYQIREAAE